MEPALREAALAHYEELARLGKALGSPVRLRIVDLLRQAPRSVEEIASATGASVANCSQHLQQLKAARLVTSSKDGQHVVYRLAAAEVGGFFVALRALGGAVLPELDRLQKTLQQHDDAHRDGLLRRIAAREVTLLDVRPAEDWRGGHLLDAIHIPLAELPGRLAELPRKRAVVAYCRGPYCPLAVTAVAMLQQAGFTADHLDLGPADLAAGPPLARRLVVRGTRFAGDAPTTSSVPGRRGQSAGRGPIGPTKRSPTRTRSNTPARSPT